MLLIRLYFSFQDAAIAKQLVEPATFGPQILHSPSFYGVRSRRGEEIGKSEFNLAEMVAISIAIYYVLDLTYPASYAQLLGAFQEGILGQDFASKGLALKVFSNK